MDTHEERRVCFVMMPLGSQGSLIRDRSDKVLRHVITPAVEECGYQAVRADQISEPGMITRQIITHIIDAPMVVADLTSHNPNVFYELAIRHAVSKPVVKIIQTGESIPFDVGQSRTIFLDHTDLSSAAACRDELVRQVRAAEQSPRDTDNPITEAITLKGWQESGDSTARRDAELIGLMQDISSRIARLEKNAKPQLLLDVDRWASASRADLRIRRWLSDVELSELLHLLEDSDPAVRARAISLINSLRNASVYIGAPHSDESTNAFKAELHELLRLAAISRALPDDEMKSREKQRKVQVQTSEGH